MFGPEQDVLIHSTNAHVISHNASPHSRNGANTSPPVSRPSETDEPLLCLPHLLPPTVPRFLFACLSVTPSPQAITAKVLMSTCFSGGIQLHGSPAKYDGIAVSLVQSKKQFLHTVACLVFTILFSHNPAFKLAK